ncbi:hypothetical protein L873DRAFT_1002172 [Choiromyces venosus 120613-1]|uniref:Uncharacterized protein n=1 Tax=Choiromyces venosus 120613-1 TaxID=1336337 RepID=A0A3N4JS10_9PEZI|nr:hypothetical protein L873DRAFT_1002172 [Choiromyces venosus 120613-1]
MHWLFFSVFPVFRICICIFFFFFFHVRVTQFTSSHPLPHTLVVVITCIQRSENEVTKFFLLRMVQVAYGTARGKVEWRSKKKKNRFPIVARPRVFRSRLSSALRRIQIPFRSAWRPYKGLSAEMK